MASDGFVCERDQGLSELLDVRPDFVEVARGELNAAVDIGAQGVLPFRLPE